MKKTELTEAEEKAEVEEARRQVSEEKAVKEKAVRWEAHGQAESHGEREIGRAGGPGGGGVILQTSYTMCVLGFFNVFERLM